MPDRQRAVRLGDDRRGAGHDPNTGDYFDDTKRYVDACADLTDEERHKIFEANARRVYPRLDSLLKQRAVATAATA